MNSRTMNANVEQTIRGLQFRGGICVAAFSKHFAIRHLFIDQWIWHQMEFLRARELPAWNTLGCQLELRGRGDFLPKEVDLLLNDHNREPFLQLINHATEIGIADMFAASSDEPSRNFRRCCEIATDYGVNLPFHARDTPVQIYEWGEPIDDSFFEQLLSEYAEFVPTNRAALRHKLE